tara:strand:+ start:1784 stop:2536 length:753 start_codon:yes stop_codon:yes gene_type:complete
MNNLQYKIMHASRRNFTKQLVCTSFALPFLTLLPHNSSASTYIVKKGDTLSKIAKANETSVSKIKRSNQLKSDLIIVGQKLTLPTPDYYSYKDPLRHIQFQNTKIKIDNDKWKLIVVHHSATERGNASIFDRSHRKRGMQNGLAYHFVIGNGSDSKDGQIEIGPRWKEQLHGGHVKSEFVNQIGIGICLVGNFEKTKPTNAQIKSLIALIDWLQTKVIRRKLKFAGHKDIEKNLCPGKNFPLKALHKRYA